jgi:hypothetical protein
MPRTLIELDEDDDRYVRRKSGKFTSADRYRWLARGWGSWRREASLM